MPPPRRRHTGEALWECDLYSWVAPEEQGMRSAINEILVISGDWLGRITVILIDEALGF